MWLAKDIEKNVFSLFFCCVRSINNFVRKQIGNFYFMCVEKYINRVASDAVCKHPKHTD